MGRCLFSRLSGHSRIHILAVSLSSIPESQIVTEGLSADMFHNLKRTGPFAVAAGLACFGGCEASGIKLYDNCMKAKGSDPSIPDHWKRTNPNTGGADVSGNVCLDIKDNLKFECPAMQNALLGYHNCPAPSQDGVSGSIHF